MLCQPIIATLHDCAYGQYHAFSAALLKTWSKSVYIEAEQTKIPTLARAVLAQLWSDDRRIEWASSLEGAEDLLVGTSMRPAVSSAEGETEARSLDRARTVFEEMQQQYASGNFARNGESLQQLGNC